MAPKTHPLPHRTSKEEQEREPSSDEEEETESQSSSGDKENSSDGTEEGSSKDEEVNQEIARNNKPPIQAPKSEPKPIPQEKGSDSDPESDGSPSNYKLQPIRKQSASSAKRPRQEGDSSQDPSRSSKHSKTEEKKSSSTPGGCITRLWSDADEIAVLSGLIELRKAEGLDPNSEGIYNFIKGKLQADFSKDQLRTKISRMKKRFLNALKKGEKGMDPVFSKPHEVKAFELSKRIWGDTINDRPVGVKIESTKKDVVKPEKAVLSEKSIVMEERDREEGDFWSKYPFFSMSFDNVVGNFPSLAMSQAGSSLLKQRVSLIGNAKAKEFDEKWRQLIVEQTELNYKMLTLMQEQVRMALNQ